MVIKKRFTVLGCAMVTVAEVGKIACFNRQSRVMIDSYLAVIGLTVSVGTEISRRSVALARSFCHPCVLVRPFI